MDRSTLLDAFRGLRLADVRDGLDAVGYPHLGTLSPTIRPLWRTTAYGIARTARYLPYQGPLPPSGEEEYLRWSGWYYGNVCSYPWSEHIQPGDFVALDCSGVNAGLIGSENSLAYLRKGMAGLVTSGGIRDTDEVIRQKVPCWSAMCSQSMVQTRLQFDQMDVPVCVGGQTICPGDLVIADGDGVLVVPQAVAMEVASYAQGENRRDRAARRAHYEALGLEQDETTA